MRESADDIGPARPPLAPALPGRSAMPAHPSPPRPSQQGAAAAAIPQDPRQTLARHLAAAGAKPPAAAPSPRRTAPPATTPSVPSRIAGALPPVVVLSARRIAEAAITLIVLVTLVFVLAHLAPGGAAYAILGQRATPSAVGAVDLRLGLDVPIWGQYLIYWTHLARGDLGNSYLLNRPVAALLAAYVGRTLTLYAAGLALGAALALTGGALHGMWFQRKRGRALAVAELTLYALPSFFVGTMLMAVFATGLHWLPPGGAGDLRLATPRPGDTIVHLILPALTVALAAYAGLAPYFAQAVHQELQAPYARTARAKGLSPWQVFRRHVLRNALRPLVTMLGLSFPALVAGSVVVESVFSYPGMGWLLWRSALSHDYPVIIGIVLLIGVATILGNLAAELINTWLDPRARYV
jgi:peptide/nickel transport system permease protein